MLAAAPLAVGRPLDLLQHVLDRDAPNGWAVIQHGEDQLQAHLPGRAFGYLQDPDTRAHWLLLPADAALGQVSVAFVAFSWHHCAVVCITAFRPVHAYSLVFTLVSTHTQREAV